MALGLALSEAPRTAVRQLAADGQIACLSPDRLVSALGHLERTTRAEYVRWLISSKTELIGEGIGVAILDSGVDNGHVLLSNSHYNSPTDCKVYDNFDFTGNSSYLQGDAFGHGTPVFGLLAGTSNYYNGSYRGISSDAKLLNLRGLMPAGSVQPARSSLPLTGASPTNRLTTCAPST